MGKRTLINVQSFVLQANVVFIYFYKQVVSMKQFHKTFVDIWFKLNILESGDQPVE